MRFAPVFPGLLLLLVVFTDANALDIASLGDPRPSRWSLDHSGQLDQATLNALDELGQRVRSDTGHELVVVAVTSTDGESQRTLGMRLFNRWEIGNGARHDGVLLFVALGDRRVEFVLGDGIDENRHVAISQEIVDQDMLPRFRSGDPNGAVLAGARAAARRLLGLPDAIATPQVAADVVSVREQPRIVADPVTVEEPLVEHDPATATALRPAVSPPTTYPVSAPSAPTQSEPGWGWFGLAGAGGGGVVGFLLWRRWLRNRSRNCPSCQQPMLRLGEHEDDQHLDHGEKTEERVGSVDYDLWACTACPQVLKLRYGTWFTSYARCPRCHAVTKSSNETTLFAATYDHGGQVRVDEACVACDYRNSYTRSTPRKTRPSTGNRGGISFGSGGGGGGGGRSGGGGGGGRSSGRGGGGGW